MTNALRSHTLASTTQLRLGGRSSTLSLPPFSDPRYDQAQAQAQVQPEVQCEHHETVGHPSLRTVGRSSSAVASTFPLATTDNEKDHDLKQTGEKKVPKRLQAEFFPMAQVATTDPYDNTSALPKLCKYLIKETFSR